MSKPVGYVDAAYLEAAGKATLPIKHKSYALMRLSEGHTVLDVGCGPGFDTVNLAKLVQAAGSVIGVDVDNEMILRANQYAASAGVSGWASHRQADAAQLPFEADFFDACRSEKLLQHLAEPEQALREMVRVTKPGGWIVVIDTDWGTLSADTPEPDIARRLWHFRAKNFQNGFAGRQLYRLFRQQHLAEIMVEPYMSFTTNYGFARWMIQADEFEPLAISAGVISPEELERLNRGFEKADEAGVYFGTIGGVIAAGRKP